MGMTVCGLKFGDKPVLSASRAAEQASKHGIPTDAWIGKANSFTSPIGPAPGRGWLLMRRGDLQGEGSTSASTYWKEEPHDLVWINGPDETDWVTLQNLNFIRAVNIFPSDLDDPNAIMLVEISDNRHLARRSFIDSQWAVYGYDVVVNDAFIATNLSWEGMVGALWGSSIYLGTYPGLPFAPAGEPRNFRFMGMSAYDALNAALASINCAIAHDPVSGTYDIYRIGDTSTLDQEGEMSNLHGKLIFDAQPIESDRGRLPSSVKVCFNAANRSTSPTPADAFERYPIYVRTITPAGASQGAGIQTLWADTIALYDQIGNLRNQTALDARAQQMADDWMIAQRFGRRWMHRIYSGPIGSVVPGPDVTAIRWKALAAGGMVTEIIRRPELLADAVAFPGPHDTPEANQATRPPDLASGRPPSFRLVKGVLAGELADQGTAQITVYTRKVTDDGWQATAELVDVDEFLGVDETIAAGTKVIAVIDDNSGRGLLLNFRCT